MISKPGDADALPSASWGLPTPNIGRLSFIVLKDFVDLRHFDSPL